jgi:hypothetical protein
MLILNSVGLKFLQLLFERFGGEEAAIDVFLVAVVVHSLLTHIHLATLIALKQGPLTRRILTLLLLQLLPRTKTRIHLQRPIHLLKLPRHSAHAQSQREGRYFVEIREVGFCYVAGLGGGRGCFKHVASVEDQAFVS